MNSGKVSLVCPLIVMRSGGLDGVALQVREYRYLLNKINMRAMVVTGKNEQDTGPVDPIGHTVKIVSHLGFTHPDSKLLFANLFTHGSEKNGFPEIDENSWMELFLSHKAKIKKRLDTIINNLSPDVPVFIFNLVSLRHAHPAAAMALRELIEEHPDRGFISHSADPDVERPEKINRVKRSLLPFISATPISEPYSGGPLNLPNLYHIVLNPTQHRNFKHTYGIPKSNIAEIPDFLEFKSGKLPQKAKPGVIFMDYLADHALASTPKGYRYRRRDVTKKTIFILSPVRPVYRKRLKESMFVTARYARKRGLDIAYVVTHPNKDDTNYFIETVRFADQLDLPFYHLGRIFSLPTLENVYEHFSPLNTIGVVASSSGGWENALNEMGRAGIPFHMDLNLNSYKPLTEKIGLETHGTDFSVFTKHVEALEKGKKIAERRCAEELKRAFDWFDSMLDPQKRQEVIEHNYRKCHAYLSHKATKPKLIKLIKKIRKNTK